MNYGLKFILSEMFMVSLGSLPVWIVWFDPALFMLPDHLNRDDYTF